jgi:PAS domain S-box-containing protein
MAERFSDLEPTALLAAIVAASPDAIVSKDLNGIITSWNAGAERMFGYSSAEIIGKSILIVIPPERHSEEQFILDTIRSGKSIDHYDTVRRRKDGTLFHASLSVSPIFDAERNIVGVSKIARDITSLKVAQQTQTLLLRELNHRSKNLLAVADAILRQTAKHTPPEELVVRVSRRFHALSVNQDLLIDTDWRGADLDKIVRSQIGALIEDVDSHIHIVGPAILISPAAAQAIGMAIFELASNAVKYGSLLVPSGRVEVEWHMHGEGKSREFTLTWTEDGGPPPMLPEHKGFGSTIIEGMVARSLLGRAAMEFAPTGVIWRLVAPASSLLGADVILSEDSANKQNAAQRETLRG